MVIGGLFCETVKVKGDERKLLEAEISGEEQKLKIETTILELEKRIEQCLAPFNQKVNLSVQHMKDSSYTYDAEPYLEEAMVILQEIIKIIIVMNIKLVNDRVVGHLLTSLFGQPFKSI